jgi:Icc-related predicted phosphoesterase
MTKILAFTDSHGEARNLETLIGQYRKGKPDLVVSSGDLTFFGTNYERYFAGLRDIDRTVYYVPGNHESLRTWKLLDESYPQLRNVSYRIERVGGIQICGIPGEEAIAPATREDDSVFDKAMKAFRALDRREPVLLLTHYAPAGTRCDGILRGADSKPIDLPYGDGGGSHVVRRIVDALKPDQVICGHYHQAFGEKDVLGPTRVLNPGPGGTCFTLSKGK